MRLHETYTRLYGTYNRGAWVRHIVVRYFMVVYCRFFVPEGVPVLNLMQNERENSLR